ncbi:MAG TPA: GAF domain-containing sensor histidine kinase [Candidatus Limnocylindrales bacterium]|nr:GAF domain-containing sensor histidine kinase [Candidatus Limnocylindrales bacterium]
MPRDEPGQASDQARAADHARDDADLARDLRDRLAELAGINAIGIALGSTRDLDELVDRGLGEIVGNLGFGRGLIAFVDPASGTLGDCRVAGGSPGLGVLVTDLRVALDDETSALAALARADGPLRFRDADADPDEGNRRIAAVLGSTGFVGTPLVTQGRCVGVLLVDDRRASGDLRPADGPLLYTVGSLFAGAMESARLYAALEAQNRALEQRVAERTADLVDAMAEADAARRAAEDANEAKSRFLANVSHELRTPLTSVVGFAKLNRKRLDDVVFPVVPREDPRVDRAVRQVGDNIGIIVAEGERLTGLINDLLDLAKIEAGRFEWHMAPLAVEDVVRQALASTAALFEASGLALEVTVEDGLPAVDGDRDRLVQVVINLVSNAVKFTPAGGVRVAVAADEDGVRVAVTDSGRGIAADDLERIFEPFRQASDTVPDGPRGTGLGLPISRQIVEAHGGAMGVESAPGAGSTFWFRLPARGASAPD